VIAALMMTSHSHNYHKDDPSLTGAQKMFVLVHLNTFETIVTLHWLRTNSKYNSEDYIAIAGLLLKEAPSLLSK
jgi:hypothetical protein